MHERLDRLRAWARRVKRDAVALWFATRQPDTPLAVKLLAVFVVAYALSPIDLIPDFIPVLGLLDDLLLLPALIWLAARLTPAGILARSRRLADEWLAREGRRPTSRWGAVLVVSIWLAVGAGVYVGWRHAAA